MSRREPSINRISKRKILQRFTIPKCTGKAFLVNKDQILRVIEIEGKQVADLTFFNALDHKETYSANFTYYLNCIQGTGNWFSAKKLYSKPPWSRVMFTTLDDPVARHAIGEGTFCCRHGYELQEKAVGHRSCEGNFREALEQFGLGVEDIGDALNLWMNVEITDMNNGCLSVKPPITQKGDHIDLLAEMDCIVAVSACPSDKFATNDYDPKAVGIEVFGD